MVAVGEVGDGIVLLHLQNCVVHRRNFHFSKHSRTFLLALVVV